MQRELLSDEQIVELIRGGMTGLFGVLMQRHKNKIFGIAYNITKCFNEAEDIVQETFCRALVRLEQFDGLGRFSSWLARIAVHEALGRKRLQCRVHWDDCDPDTLATQARGGSPRRGSCPEKSAFDSQLGAMIMRAVNQLPSHFRSVFIKRAMEELSTAETAMSLGITPQTVKTRFHRAKRLLKKELGMSLGVMGGL